MKVSVPIIFASSYPWSQPNPPPKKVNFDGQVALSQSSLAQANPYYPVPAPSPPWVHPSPSSDTTPTTNSPPSSLTHYATPALSPPAPIEPLPSATIDARGLQDNPEDVEPTPQSPPATRSTHSTGRRPGACSRCKKLKMRCAFGADSRSCIRCAAGSHQCIVEGRKARTPGQRENLLRQIREKNETISVLLHQLRNTTIATPISINAARLSLKPNERESHGEVLSWMERRHAVSTQASEKACVAYDTSQLEDDDMYSSSEDDDENDEDGSEKAVVRSALASHGVAALPEDAAPLGFLASFSSHWNNSSVRSSSPLGTDVFGIANKRYFQPSPYTDLNLRRIVIEREMVPEILISGLITPQEARELFDLFFDHINPYLSLLDEAIHSAASVMRRCPFLFTVVCAISSRYYKRPGLYKLAIHFAKAGAASAFIDGWKCVEMCQAYLMLTAYAAPTQRFEDSRSGFYSGVATRLAIELGLNRDSNVQPLDERHERELLNRRRTWMICSIMDGSTSLETGKAPGVRKDDELTSNASRWCSASKFQHPFDADLPAIIELLSIMHRFTDCMKRVGYEKKSRALDRLISSFDRDLQTSIANTTVKANERRAGRDLAGKHRLGMVLFLYQYCRIIIHSFGHKAEAKDTAPQTKPSAYVDTCMEAAFALLNLWLEYMHSTGHVRYAPDFFFVGTGFAGAFLLELLSPHIAPTLTTQQRARVINVCEAVVKQLHVAAVDDSHVPYSYAVFLENALQKAVPEPPIPAPAYPVH
ncbi:fungal-specific transcription factor domain-containing protein [Lactarius indigo]|nr:fungal-specific transcription factor domain-containing protein [Lactarius indigo]